MSRRFIVLILMLVFVLLEWIVVVEGAAGDVHIAHWDQSNTDLRYCNNTGGTWSCVAIDTTNDVGEFSSMALDSSNVVHISHNENNDALRYCNNTGGSWSCLEVETTGFSGETTSLGIDSIGIVHISHQDNSANDLRYCNNTGGAWSCVAVETSVDYGESSSMTIDSNEIIHISHFDGTNFDLRYCNNTASSWSCMTIESNNQVGGYSSIGLDSSENLHISHYDLTNDDLRYCNNTAGAWSCAAIDTVDDVGSYSSLAIDSSEGVHIVHTDQFFALPENVRYCNNTAGGAWSCVVSASGGSPGPGGGNSEAIDENDFIHFATYHSDDKDLIYCNNTAGAWSCATLETTGIIGGYPSIFIEGQTSRSNVQFVASDTSNPQVTINFPANVTYNAGNLPFDWNVTLDENGTVEGTLDGGVNNITMSGNESELFGTMFNASNGSIADGQYTFVAYANDTAGNRNDSESIVFVLDQTFPVVTINNPISQTFAVSNFDVNITLNEAGYCEFSLSSGEINYTLTDNGGIDFNSTNGSIANGDYFFTAYCNDTAGNRNDSTNVSFSVSVISDSGGNGGGGGGGDDGGRPRLSPPDCDSKYNCGDWSVCIDGERSKICSDAICFGDDILQKASCNLDFCIPNWDCSGWSACIEADKIEEGREGFVQTRECRDLNGCGNIRRKPIEIVECNTLGCLSDFECGNGKGLCDYNENTIEILMGKEILHGLEVRECSDLNECADDYTDNRACVSDSNIYFEEKLVCGKKNIVAYNTETDRPIFQIDLEKWRNDEFNVLFLQSDVIYCESCYNGLRDSEEGDVDCGGECKECLPEVKGISFIKNTKWSLWFLILLLIALLVWLWNEERRKRRRIKKKALDWIRASFLELKT